jgi:hypothetical protein
MKTNDLSPKKYLANIQELTDNARLKGLSCAGTNVRCYKCDSFFHVMKYCSKYKYKSNGEQK